MYYSTEYPSPVGTLTLCSDGEALKGLWLEGQKYHSEGYEGKMERDDDLAAFGPVREWLDRYFAGKRPLPSEIPLDPDGSGFRLLVWKRLADIPYGETTTYGAIARWVAQQQGRDHMASLAVGGAVGHNPISIIIPCHRVVGTSGSLTGYSGGIAKKTWLLEHEGVDMSDLFAPKKGTAL